MVSWLTINLFKERYKGFPIFFEAGLLFLINCIYFETPNKRIINYILQPGTDKIEILTVMLLSLGFIYYMGYFIATRLMDVKLNLGGGGPLTETILPYGAIFLLAISISPIMIYLSEHQLPDIQELIKITFGLVFIFGFFNELITQIFIQINATPQGERIIEAKKILTYLKEKMNAILQWLLTIIGI